MISAGLVSAAVSAAPVTFNTALPVAKGEYVARVQVVAARSGDDPSGAGRDRREHTIVAALGHGISGRLAVFGILPYRDTRLRADGMSTRGTSGMGDLTLLARYTAWQHNERGATLRLAPFAGFKLPTGADDTRDALGPLPVSVQAGTGSTDTIAGLIVTRQTLMYQLDAQLSYRINGAGNGFEAGNVLRLDGSLQYRLGRSRTGGVPDFLYGVVEANVVYHRRDRLNGAEEPNSGGWRVFMAPGIQYVTRRWIAEAVIQVPVIQDLNGTALEAGPVARAGMRVNF